MLDRPSIKRGTDPEFLALPARTDDTFHERFGDLVLHWTLLLRVGDAMVDVSKRVTGFPHRARTRIGSL